MKIVDGDSSTLPKETEEPDLGPKNLVRNLAQDVGHRFSMRAVDVGLHRERYRPLQIWHITSITGQIIVFLNVEIGLFNYRRG